MLFVLCHVVKVLGTSYNSKNPHVIRRREELP